MRTGILFAIGLLLAAPGAEGVTRYVHKYPGSASAESRARAMVYTSIPAGCDCQVCQQLPPGCDCTTCGVLPPITEDTHTTGGGGSDTTGGGAGTTEEEGGKSNTGAIAGAAGGAAAGILAAAAAARYLNKPPGPIDAVFEGDEGASVQEAEREVVARQESADFAG